MNEAHSFIVILIYSGIQIEVTVEWNRLFQSIGKINGCINRWMYEGMDEWIDRQTLLGGKEDKRVSQLSATAQLP